MPRLNWKALAIYLVVLTVCWFAVTLYQNQRIIARQRREISSLKRLMKSLKSEQAELGFVRRSLLAREPYFYIKSLREDWGFRRRGERDVMSLPVRRHIARGVPVYRISSGARRRSGSGTAAILVLLAGLTFATVFFLMLFSVLSRPTRADPVEEIKRIITGSSAPQAQA